MTTPRPDEALEAVVAADVPVTVVARRGLRGGLRRLSAGLIAYGLAGLVLAILGLLALVYVGARLDALTERISGQVESIALTLDDTAEALADAGSSATSFASTLDRTPATLEQVATTVTSLQADLVRVGSDLDAITILGARPLGQAADLFADMAADLEGLDARVTAIGTDLGQNRERLATSAASLDLLGDRLVVLAGGLRRDVVADSLGDVRAVVTVLMLLFVGWAGLPAAGALALGLWLRRELAAPPGRSGPVARPG